MKVQEEQQRIWSFSEEEKNRADRGVDKVEPSSVNQWHRTKWTRPKVLGLDIWNIWRHTFCEIKSLGRMPTSRWNPRRKSECEKSGRGTKNKSKFPTWYSFACYQSSLHFTQFFWSKLPWCVKKVLPDICWEIFFNQIFATKVLRDICREIVF